MGRGAGCVGIGGVIARVPRPSAGAARLAAGDLADEDENSGHRGVGAMGKVKIGWTADEGLKRLGKPTGRSIVEGDDDPVVIWPYGKKQVRFQYRDKAWRVVRGA